jgi:hypothetical protein
MKDWLYYRIYAKPNLDDWYPRLLREVVQPFISKNEKSVDSFFFFWYRMQYGIHEGLEKGCEQKFEVGEWVSFIRFRVLAERENISNLEGELLKFIKMSPTVLETEKCTYNEKGDLGGRFGETRRELVRKYLEYASRITLSLLAELKDDKYYDNIGGLIHLPSNMLNYVIECPKCKIPILLCARGLPCAKLYFKF